MTKAELVAKIAKDAGITTVEAYKVLDSIKKAVGTEDKVVLTGFGTFEHKARAARSGKIAFTGKSWTAPAKVVITFKASKNLLL